MDLFQARKIDSILKINQRDSSQQQAKEEQSRDHIKCGEDASDKIQDRLKNSQETRNRGELSQIKSIYQKFSAINITLSAERPNVLPSDQEFRVETPSLATLPQCSPGSSGHRAREGTRSIQVGRNKNISIYKWQNCVEIPKSTKIKLVVVVSRLRRLRGHETQYKPRGISTHQQWTGGTSRKNAIQFITSPKKWTQPNPHIYTKANSKRIMGLNVKCKTMKLLEKTNKIFGTYDEAKHS